MKQKPCSKWKKYEGMTISLNDNFRREDSTQTNDFIVTKFQSLSGMLEGKNVTYILETVL